VGASVGSATEADSTSVSDEAATAPEQAVCNITRPNIKKKNQRFAKALFTFFIMITPLYSQDLSTLQSMPMPLSYVTTLKWGNKGGIDIMKTRYLE
jgi:hypothetical protein